MPDGIRWVGLDVHARESTFAVFDQGTGELTTRRVVGRPHELLPWLRGVERPARMVYEAGPTGYGLARRALAEGIEIGVCAPGKTERPPADRVKTDKRDAIRLARLLAAGELTLVTIPSVEREQLRDLVRCREDIRADLMRARHRIGKFLLRREIYWEGTGETWSRKHRSWLTSVRFADQASRATHGGLPARPRRADRPPRPGRSRARKARDERPVRAHGRQATVPARDRHAHSARAVRRDRRVGALRPSRPAVGLPRDRPVRAHQRQPAPARGRSPRPAPRTPAGCWSRRPSTTAAAPRSVKRSSAASAAKHPRSSTSPGKRNAGSTPAGASSKTPAANPAGSSRSRRPRARRLLLGDRHLPHRAATDTHTNHSQEAYQLALTPPRTTHHRCG